MDTTAKRTLRDVIEVNLAGWQLVTCYFLEREHGLTARYPALSKEGGEPIIVTDRALLRPVWSRLGRDRSRMTDFLGIIHVKSGEVFSLNSEDGSNAAAVRLFSEAEIATLIDRRPDSFTWGAKSHRFVAGPRPDFGPPES